MLFSVLPFLIGYVSFANFCISFFSNLSLMKLEPHSRPAVMSIDRLTNGAGIEVLTVRSYDLFRQAQGVTVIALVRDCVDCSTSGIKDDYCFAMLHSMLSRFLGRIPACTYIKLTSGFGKYAFSSSFWLRYHEHVLHAVFC
jgi:hypothetical protein